MTHKEQLDFVERVKCTFPFFFKNKMVLELGSYNVNGTVRQFFTDCDYHGIDIVPGPCVDQVSDARTVGYQAELFDVVISCEVFEHLKDWPHAFLNGYRMLKQGGLFIMTAAGPNRAEHGTLRTSPNANPGAETTGDYYQNITIAQLELLNIDLMFDDPYVDYARHKQDVYFWGIKRTYKGQQWRA